MVCLCANRRHFQPQVVPESDVAWMRANPPTEPTNPHDAFAVEIQDGSAKLGYVPGFCNRHVNRLLVDSVPIRLRGRALRPAVPAVGGSSSARAYAPAVNNSLPCRLIFCNENGKFILQNLELKVTPPNELNDPCEMRPVIKTANPHAWACTNASGVAPVELFRGVHGCLGRVLRELDHLGRIADNRGTVRHQRPELLRRRVLDQRPVMFEKHPRRVAKLQSYPGWVWIAGQPVGSCRVAEAVFPPFRPAQNLTQAAQTSAAGDLRQRHVTTQP